MAKKLSFSCLQIQKVIIYLCATASTLHQTFILTIYNKQGKCGLQLSSTGQSLFTDIQGNTLRSARSENSSSLSSYCCQSVSSGLRMCRTFREVSWTWVNTRLGSGQHGEKRGTFTLYFSTAAHLSESHSGVSTVYGGRRPGFCTAHSARMQLMKNSQICNMRVEGWQKCSSNSFQRQQPQNKLHG